MKLFQYFLVALFFATSGMAAELYSNPRAQYLDTNGDPYSGGKLYFYETGTTTPKDTYADSALSSANANPVVLDSAGRISAVFLDGCYKVALKTSADVTVWTQDNYCAEDTENVLEVSNVAAMTALTKSSLSDGDQVQVAGYTTAGDAPVRALYWDANGSDTTQVCTVYASDEGGTGRWKYTPDGILDVRHCGAIEGTSDTDTTAIQAALDYANTKADNVVVTLAGLEFKATGLEIKNRTIFENGVISDGGTTTTDGAIIHMGDSGGEGDYLVRQSVARNILVKTSSTATGVTGFRMNNYVRGSTVDVECEMNGDVAGTRNHKCFELLAGRIAATTNAGSYQNDITVHSRFANTGARIATEGTAAQATADPQANGNKIKVYSFSDREFGLHLDEGSQENHFWVRADTYADATGNGTTISPLVVDGRYNKGLLNEEVGGSRADTQYSVWFGAESKYNFVEYSTQNVTTAKVKDDSTDTYKNVARQIGNGIFRAFNGGDVATVDFYADSVAVSSTERIATWVAREKAVLLGCTAQSDATITNGTAVAIFGKNGSTTLEHIGSSDVDFTAPDQIVTGGSPDLTTFLEAGDKVVISGSSSNDGTYEVESVTSTTITTVETTLTTEANQSANIYPNPRTKLSFTSVDGTTAKNLTVFVSDSNQVSKVYKFAAGDSLEIKVENISASEAKTIKGACSILYTGT